MLAEKLRNCRREQDEGDDEHVDDEDGDVDVHTHGILNAQLLCLARFSVEKVIFSFSYANS